MPCSDRNWLLPAWVRGGELREQPVHLGLGAHVDPAGGLVDDQHLRSGGQPLGEHDLLLVATGERGDRVGDPGVLHLELHGPVERATALGAPVHQAGPYRLLESRQADVALDRHAHHQALGAPVLGNHGHTRRHRGRGRTGLQLAPADLDFTAVPAVDPEDRAGDLRTTGADESGKSHDLSGAHLEGHIGEHAFAGQPAYVEGDFARGHVLLGVQLIEVAPDHAAHQVVLGHPVDRFTRDQRSVPQGGDPPADLEDLLQAVRDEQDGGALFAQGAYDTEEAGDLAAGQRGGRLVHDQDAGVERQGLGDLDDLLVGDRQTACGLLRVEVDAQAAHQILGRGVHPPVVDPAEGPPRLAAHEDVLGDRQVREECGLLVDHRDAGVAGVRRAVERGRCAVEQQPSGVRPVHSGERLDQRRLPGAVLTGQGVHLAGKQLQGHASQGTYRAEGLRDVLQGQYGSGARVGRVGHMGSSTTRAGLPQGAVKGFSRIAGRLGTVVRCRQWVPAGGRPSSDHDSEGSAVQHP